jgi:50S ribosomal protein L16 3-hydroxylase
MILSGHTDMSKIHKLECFQLNLDELFSPIGFDEFRSRIWPTHHFHSEGSSAWVQQILDLPYLRNIELLTKSHCGTIKALDLDETGAYNEYPVTPSEALESWRSGPSLCFGGVHWIMPVKNLLLQLADAIGVSTNLIQCNAYWSTEGKGVPKHFDNREVFIIQISGSKRWAVAENADLPYPPESHVAAKPSSEFTDTVKQSDYYPLMPSDSHIFNMVPGSILFLPRGTWHATAACEDSLSISLGFFTPTALSLLLAVLKDRLIGNPSWRKPLPSYKANLPGLCEELSLLLEQIPGELGQLRVVDLVEKLPNCS